MFKSLKDALDAGWMIDRITTTGYQVKQRIGFEWWYAQVILTAAA